MPEINLKTPTGEELTFEIKNGVDGAPGENGNNPTAGASTTLKATIGIDKFIGGFDSNAIVGTGSQTLNFGMPVSQAIGAIVFSIKSVSASVNTTNLFALM